jgi:Fe-S-cluster-containing hydrogenase component 2
VSQLHFSVLENKCIRCDTCVGDCPAGIIVRGDTTPTIMPENEENCIKCQHCLAVCPKGAVSIFGRSADDSIPLMPEVMPTLQEVETLLRGRRSVRKFQQENVSREIIDRLLATAAHSPTGCNDRDLTFSVIDDRAEISILVERLVTALESKIASGAAVHELIVNCVAAYRNNGTDVFFRGAPHLLIVSAGEKATCPQQDIDIALSYFELLAHCAGLGATWCGLLKFALDTAPELRPILGLGTDALFYAMLFGHPAVQYARTVQRDDTATIKRLTMS